MNPLALELNEVIKQENVHLYEMLSEVGKNLFFPKGILTQSAEAKEKAHRFNATIQDYVFNRQLSNSLFSP